MIGPMQEQRTPSPHRYGAAVPTVPGYDVVEPLRAPFQWWGRRHGDERQVVLVCIPTRSWSADAVQGALEGFATFSRLRHPHLLRLYDVVPDAIDPHGGPGFALAVESVMGGSFTAVLHRRGALTWGEAVTALVPVGQALSAMHEQGCVHAGLGSSVVLFTGDGMPLVAPAGLDAALRADERGGEAVVAPEVGEGFPATEASDAFAYATLIVQGLTGEVAQMRPVPEEVEDLLPDIPPDLSRALGLALSSDPTQRTDPDEIQTHLRALAATQPVVLRGSDSAADVPSRIRAAAQATGHHASRPRRYRGGHRAPPPTRPRWVAALILVLVLGCGAAWTQLGAASLEVQPTLGVTPGPALVKDASPEAAASPNPSVDAGPSPAHAHEIVQGLLEARAGAWTSGDPGDLQLAHAVASPALATDTQRLSAASARGVRLREVSFTAVDTVVLPEIVDTTSPTPDAVTPTGASPEVESFEVAATIHRDAVEIVDGRGTPAFVPTASEHVRLTVVKQGEDWRLYEWRPAPG